MKQYVIYLISEGFRYPYIVVLESLHLGCLRYQISNILGYVIIDFKFNYVISNHIDFKSKRGDVRGVFRVEFQIRGWVISIPFQADFNFTQVAFQIV